MEHYYRSIISGERAGAWPYLLRSAFGVMAVGYGAAVRARNWAFDRGLKPVHKLPVPVISVGNITTGGTGKTPTVIMICNELVKLGKHPAVLTRGYGAPRGGKADEVMVIEHECPGVPVIVNPDRVRGGQDAISKYRADVLVLDDGFQHRRLHRDLNIVLVDATAPMGIPGMLPRGTWRELPSGLARADLIMLTRCEQVTQELADLAAGLLSQWVPPRLIFQQSTKVTGLFDAMGNPVTPGGQKVLAFAGIGNPNGFVNTVKSLGLHVSAGVWFADHHPYQVPDDFVPLEKLTRERSIAAWITTHKDWVKIAHNAASVPIWHVRIESQIEGYAGEVWREKLAEVVGAKPASV